MGKGGWKGVYLQDTLEAFVNEELTRHLRHGHHVEGEQRSLERANASLIRGRATFWLLLLFLIFDIVVGIVA